MRFGKIFGFAFLALAMMHAHQPAQAIVVKRINLQEMVHAASSIFSGQCVGRQIQYDEGLGRKVCIFTFRVERLIKGVLPSTYKLKTSKTLLDIGQVPSYNVGDEVVLFLHAESAIGFTTPVGLGQGKFTVLHQPDGKRQIVNENNNKNLFYGMETDSFCHRLDKKSLATLFHHQGPVDFKLFLAVVEALMQERLHR